MVGCWCARSSLLTKDSVLKFEAVVGDGGLLPQVGVGLWFCWAEGLAPQLLLEMVDLFITKTFRLMENGKSSNMSTTKWSFSKKTKHQCGFSTTGKLPGSSSSPVTGGCASSSARDHPDRDPGCVCWPWAAFQPLVPGEAREVCRRAVRGTDAKLQSCSCWGTAGKLPCPWTSPPLPERDRHRGPSVFHIHSDHVQNLAANCTINLSSHEQETQQAGQITYQSGWAWWL